MDMFHLLRLRYDENNDAEIQCMSPCVRFAYALVFALLIIGFIYLSQCLAFAFIFGFVDGPSKSVFYVDFDDSNDMVILWLFASSLMVGFIGFCIGLFYSCCRDRQLEQSNNAEIVNSNVRRTDLRGMLERNGYNNERMNPFSDPNKGYKIINGDDDDEDDEPNHVAL